MARSLSKIKSLFPRLYGYYCSSQFSLMYAVLLSFTTTEGRQITLWLQTSPRLCTPSNCTPRTENPKVLNWSKNPCRLPGPGEVLIKVAAAAVNPSDLAFLKGIYGTRKKLPVVPGFEGSGTVVAAGSGMMSRFYLGRRVAFASGEGDGTWAEYAVTPATQCVPLPKNVTLEQGSMMMVNPLTALAFMEIIRQGRHKAII